MLRWKGELVVSEKCSLTSNSDTEDSGKALKEDGMIEIFFLRKGTYYSIKNEKLKI